MALSEAALTLRATVEAELGLSAGADTRIDGWIEDASEMIANYLGGPLYKRTVTETLFGDGGNYLVLRARPIASITSILFNTVPLVTDDFEIYDDVAGLVFLPGGVVTTLGPNVGIVGGPRYGSLGERLYAVTYVAGWVTPRQAEAGSGSTYSGATVTLPRAIQRACIELVAHLRARAGSDAGIASESMMSYSVSYRDDANDAEAGGEGIPASVRAKIRGWREPVMS